MTRLLLIPLLAMACTASPPRPPEPVRYARAEIIRRDVAFAFDSIPLLRFRPPFPYGAIRLQVEQCSGLERHGWPTFYIAAQNPMPGGVLAFYNDDANSIVFGLGQETVPQTVAHELLHFLLAPHIPSKKQPRESHEEYTQRVHPDSIYAPHVGKCSSVLYPGS